MTNSRHELNKYTIELNFFESRISILIFRQFHDMLSKLSIFRVKKIDNTSWTSKGKRIKMRIHMGFSSIAFCNIWPIKHAHVQ